MLAVEAGQSSGRGTVKEQTASQMLSTAGTRGPRSSQHPTPRPRERAGGSPPPGVNSGEAWGFPGGVGAVVLGSPVPAPVLTARTYSAAPARGGDGLLVGVAGERPRGGRRVFRVPGDQGELTPRVHSKSFCPRHGDADGDDCTFCLRARMQALQGRPFLSDGHAGEGLPFQN